MFGVIARIRDDLRMESPALIPSPPSLGHSGIAYSKKSEGYVPAALAMPEGADSIEDVNASGSASTKDDFRLCYLLSKTAGFSVKNKLVYAENIEAEFQL